MNNTVCSHAWAIIVAGGSGTRFGNPGGKLLIEVAGKPLITWTLEAFDAAERVSGIVVVCPPDKVDEMNRIAIEPFAFSTPIAFAPSGAERQDSTRNGLAAVPGDCDVVLVHDAARPLIEPSTIDSAVEELLAAGRPDAAGASGLDGVVCGQPAVDTLKVVDEDGVFVQTPPRALFWTVQTPQIFWTESLIRAYEWVDRAGFAGTDDASLVEGMGGRVRGFEAARDNLKVTLPEDLAPVEAALRRRLGAMAR